MLSKCIACIPSYIPKYFITIHPLFYNQRWKYFSIYLEMVIFARVAYILFVWWYLEKSIAIVSFTSWNILK